MKIFILTCLMLACFVCRLGAQTNESDTLPHGRWEVTQITFEKNTDGRIETIRYNTTADTKDLIRFPQSMEAGDSLRCVLSYFGIDEKRPAEYVLKGDRLTITEGSIENSYQYNQIEGSLLISIEYPYKTRQRSGERKLENVTEKWVFRLTKTTRNEDTYETEK